MIDIGAGTDPMVIPPKLQNNMTLPSIIGGHAVGSGGWCQKGLKFPNSWSERWGDKGYGYIEPRCFTWSQEYGFPIPLVEAWAVEFDDGTEPTEPQKKPDGISRTGNGDTARKAKTRPAGCWIGEPGIIWTRTASWPPMPGASSTVAGTI